MTIVIENYFKHPDTWALPTDRTNHLYTKELLHITKNVETRIQNIRIYLKILPDQKSDMILRIKLSSAGLSSQTFHAYTLS